MSVVLRPALDAEKRTRDVMTYAEWGSLLTPRQYLEREELLRARPWARQGMVTWFLLEDGQVLSSCETFRNDSTIGDVRGRSFSVATVFTEPHLRGRGYAAQLMARLVERLRLEPGAQSSVLFSDVGAPIYEKSGYRAVEAFDWILPPHANPPEAEWLDIAAAPPKVPSKKGQLVLHPSAEQFDRHFERSRLYARYLNRTPLQHYGARTVNAAGWWAANYKDDELEVLWLEASTARRALPILRAAQAQAHFAGLKRVRVWETLSLEKCPGAQRVERHGGLPMVASLGPPVARWRRVERALWV